MAFAVPMPAVPAPSHKTLNLFPTPGTPSPMNYRHAFHAGNHADVLKHTVLLALCEALVAKPSACFALDTHAGRGLYQLDGEHARRTWEATDGVGALLERGDHPALAPYRANMSRLRQPAMRIRSPSCIPSASIWCAKVAGASRM